MQAISLCFSSLIKPYFRVRNFPCCLLSSHTFPLWSAHIYLDGATSLYSIGAWLKFPPSTWDAFYSASLPFGYRGHAAHTQRCRQNRRGGIRQLSLLYPWFFSPRPNPLPCSSQALRFEGIGYTKTLANPTPLRPPLSRARTGNSSADYQSTISLTNSS